MASGDSLLIFTPLAAELPAANYAQEGMRNGHPTLDFDSVTQETIIFTAVLPRNYAGGGLTVTVESITNAITGNLAWLGSFERMDAATDLDADSFAATQTSGVATVPGVSGDSLFQTIAFTNAQIDGLLAGEPFRFRLQRDPATDTAANDGQVLTVEIKET